MACFRNHYRRERCGFDWDDEWSRTFDDDCPHCGARHMSPADSDDLTIIVTESPDGMFSVLRSPESAENEPDYAEVAHFSTSAEANAWWPK